jgi:hypothetical protein
LTSAIAKSLLEKGIKVCRADLKLLSLRKRIEGKDKIYGSSGFQVIRRN